MANCTKTRAKRRVGGVVDSYDYDYLTKLSFSFWLLRCNAGQSLRPVTQKVWPNWHRNCWKPRANCRDRTGPLRPDGPLSPWRWNRKPSYTSTYYYRHEVSIWTCAHRIRPVDQLNRRERTGMLPRSRSWFFIVRRAVNQCRRLCVRTFLHDYSIA